MLAPSELVTSTPSTRSGVSCDRLDAALIGGPYVLIDASNVGVGTASTPAKARAAIARGDGGATTYAGRVRRGVTALDIDTTDPRLGGYLVEEITGWAHRRDLWSLAVPSGGGPGRWHVFVLPDRFSAELDQLIGLLRDERGLSGRQLDVRQIIRPLGAPHRTGRRRPPVTVTAADAERVEAALRRRGGGVDRAGSGSVVSSLAAMATARPGTVTARGAAAVAALPVVIDDQGRPDRSAREFELTRRLATAKERVENVWEAVKQLDGKSAERGYRWWYEHLWSKVRPAVEAEVDELAPVDLAPLVLPTMAANRHRWEHWETRRRHSLETVLWAVLERLTGRTGEWVPMSQRDIQLATGLHRQTITARLRDAVELEVLQQRQLPARDAADEWQTGTTAVSSLNHPPVLTPPAPAWLPAEPAGSATAALDLQLARSYTRPTSTRQRRLAQARQRAAESALAEPQRRPCARRSALLAQITAERDEFYAGLQAARLERERSWWRDRRAAVAATRRRQRQWWDQLTAAERQSRRHQAQQRWHQQSAVARTRWLEQQNRARDLLAGWTPVVVHLPRTAPQSPTSSPARMTRAEPTVTSQRA